MNYIISRETLNTGILNLRSSILPQLNSKKNLKISRIADINLRFKNHNRNYQAYFKSKDFDSFSNANLNYLIKEKANQELLLEQRKISLKEHFSDVFVNVNEILKQDDISQYSYDDFAKLVQNFDLDIYSCVSLSEEYKEIKNTERLVNLIQYRINEILRKIRKTLRNLREFYKRQHSFHFKNLDDYHSFTLVNRI